MSEEFTKVINIRLPNGELMKAEIKSLGGERDVRSGDIFNFEEFTRKLEGVVVGVAGGVRKSLNILEPTRVSIEFGVEIGVESGQLTTLLGKGTTSTSFKVTAEWSK